MFSTTNFRLSVMIGTIVCSLLYLAYDHFQRRGLLISQSTNRTEHLVTHDLSIQMDQLNQIVEKLDLFCQPHSACTFEAQKIKQDLIQIWQNNRKKLKQEGVQKNFDPTINQLGEISKSIRDFLAKNGSINPKLKNELEDLFHSSEVTQKTVALTQEKYKSLLQVQQKYQKNPFLRFFLNQSQDQH